MSVLQVSSLNKSFGANKAVNNVDLNIKAGEIVALIGPNGAGKTTTFNLINGQLQADSGEILLLNKKLDHANPVKIANLGVGRTFQIAEVFTSLTVIENVQMAILANQGQVLNMLSKVSRMHMLKAMALLKQVGMQEQAYKACSELAYGNVKRLELAMALASDPKLFLMDEPTAGMAPAERQALMALVKKIAKQNNMAILFTEHSMDVVFGFAEHIVVMAQGSIVATGSPEEIQNNEQVKKIYFGGDSSNINTINAGIKNTDIHNADKNNVDIGSCNNSDKDAAMISLDNSFESHTKSGSNKAHSGNVFHNDNTDNAPLLQIKNLKSFYGAAQVLFDLNLDINQGEVVALLGLNGAGKSTTFKSIMGMMKNTQGEINFANNTISKLESHKISRLGLGYVPEDRRIFTDLTVLENLNCSKQAKRYWPNGDAAPYWSTEQLFKFFPNLEKAMHRYGDQMSGGEQQMLSVARTLMGNPYLVLLDEPSEGVAPIIVQAMVDMIKIIKASGVSVLLAEQNTDFAKQVADRAYVLEKGQIIFSGSMDEATSAINGEGLRLPANK